MVRVPTRRSEIAPNRKKSNQFLQGMFVMKLVKASAGGILLLFASFAVMEEASANQGSVYAIICANCLHVQDFANAAKVQANTWSYRSQKTKPSNASLHSGLYVVSSNVAPLSALIKISGYWRYDGLNQWGMFVTAMTPVRMDGTTANYTDADLQYSEVGLFGNSRSATIVTTQVTLPDFSGDGLNNDALLELLTRGIAYEMAGRDPNWSNNMSVGAFLKVTWIDGTNAVVQRTSKLGTVQFAILPGTLRNKQGKLIDNAGNVLTNQNPIPGNPVGGPFTETSMTGSPSYVTFIPDNLPSGTATITWPDGTQTQDGVSLPPGG
jgi:hypothetical protein